MAESRRAYVLGDGEGEAFWFAGSLMVLKAGGAQTDGRFAMLEQRVPGGYAVPLHVHRHEDEAWYVLEGDATFHCGDEVLSAGPGSWVFLPREQPHTFKAGPDGARLLTMTVPSRFADFVRAAGEPAREKSVPPPAPLDEARLGALAAEHGIEMLGPPPA